MLPRACRGNPDFVARTSVLPSVLLGVAHPMQKFSVYAQSSVSQRQQLAVRPGAFRVSPGEDQEHAECAG